MSHALLQAMDSTEESDAAITTVANVSSATVVYYESLHESTSSEMMSFQETTLYKNESEFCTDDFSPSSPVALRHWFLLAYHWLHNRYLIPLWSYVWIATGVFLFIMCLITLTVVLLLLNGHYVAGRTVIQPMVQELQTHLSSYRAQQDCYAANITA